MVDARSIHIWCAFFDEIDDAGLLAEYEQLLSPDERDQWPRFVFERDRRRYLVTRALVRTALSRYADVAPAAWTFEPDRFGRPLITNDHAAARDIAFNITHTNSLIALAVTGGPAIGIDTERVRAFDALLDLAEQSLTPREVEALRSCPEELQPRRFLEYWTLKEAYLKARSVGLSVPLEHVALRFDPSGRISLWVDPVADCGTAWRLWQFSIAGYIVAVCAERAAPEAPALVVRKVVPLRTDESLAYENLRISE